jgi:hypothetical protein
VSLFGVIVLWLSYYRCQKCGTSQKPWDTVLGLTEHAVTPAVSQVASQAGVLSSFADAAERTLPKMCGLRISESTVERLCEEQGESLKQQLAKGQTGPRQSWSWQRDAAGRTCAYVGLDHTGIPQQGPEGARADCRMAAVALVYNPQSDHDDRPRPPHQVRFLSGFYELDEIGRALRREAEAVGIMDADVQLAFSDGGSGLERTLTTFFPRAICILDFWHAKEHLVELAKAVWPDDEECRQGWLNEQCHRLKHQGGAAVLRELELLDVSTRNTVVQETHRRQLVYFRNHAHRMDYPTYVANGWQIGSGPIESACKTVVGNRLKGGGMRWGEPGSDAICHLRAVYLSDPTCWDALWSRSPT